MIRLGARAVRLVVDAAGLALVVAMVAELAGAWSLGAAGVALIVLGAAYGPEDT